jgi:unspecific monooxygenase
VLAEVDRVIGDRLPTAEDAHRLPVTEAVVQETLRLYPPLWLTERAVTVPTELGGYRLRPGQKVSLSPYVMHRDPRYYRQPHVFVPDRWLDRSATGELPKYAFMPFGGGPRLCLGAAFAKVAMVIAAATVLRRCRLRQAAGTTTTLSTRTILQPDGLTMRVH